jgi:HEAT repeats
MAPINSHVRFHSTRRGRSAHRPWQVMRDALLALLVVLLLCFVAVQTNPALATSLSGVLGLHAAGSARMPVNPNSVPALIADLTSPMTNVRRHAAETLGSEHATPATDALLAATYDSDPGVREQAVLALGDLGALQTLPRLEELQLTSANTFIEGAAFQAQTQFTQAVATALNVPVSSIQALTVADNGIAYAAALNELYALRGGDWLRISQLPAIANDLSAGPNGQLVLLSTVSSGLYRSQDGGATWEHLQYGLQTPTQLKTTAVLVNPQNPNQMFVALAVNGTTDAALNALGVTMSGDGGATWLMLPQTPTWSVTRQMVIDRTTLRYLYGMTDVGPWRYDLVNHQMD